MIKYDIERELRVHFGKRNRLSAIINKGGETFFVDPMEGGGFAVQAKGDLRRIVHVNNLTKAAAAIADWGLWNE